MPRKKYSPPSVGRRESTVADRMLRMVFGDAVHEARIKWQEASGQPPRKLPAFTKVSQNAQYKIEDGSADPKLTTLIRLTSALPLKITIQGGKLKAEVIAK